MSTIPNYQAKVKLTTFESIGFLYVTCWKYLRAYWLRFALGIIFGLSFGIFNGTLLLATKVIADRMTPQKISTPVQAVQKSGGENTATYLPSKIKVQAKKVQAVISQAVDGWLPRINRPLDWRQSVGVVLVLPLFMFLRGAISYLSSYYFAWVGLRVSNNLRLDALAKLHTLSLDYYNKRTTADLMTRIGGDTVVVRTFLSLGFNDVIKEPVTFLSVFGAMLYTDWKLTLIACTLMPACLVPMRILNRKSRAANRADATRMMHADGGLFEAMANIRVVKSFRLEQQQQKEFRESLSASIKYNMRNIKAKELLNPIIETISMLGVGFILLYVLIYKVPFSNVLVFIFGIATLFSPLKKIAGLHNYFSAASFSIDRLSEFLSEKPTVVEKNPAVPLVSFTDKIVLDRVGFSYGEGQILHSLSLEIPRGMKLGIAGESGSGKSTLINLLLRFYDPTEGRIIIDGVDLRDLSFDCHRHLMSLVSQEVLLFNRSIAENIEFGRLGASRQQIEEAARGAFAHDFIKALPEGYDTRIGERGVRLSGGQRQRLAIARAFVRNAPILVLDEATASLDSASEEEVQDAIDRLAVGRTVISIAHRLSTLKDCDKIIVLESGRITEQGTLQELIAAQGAFARMAGRQGMS